MIPPSPISTLFPYTTLFRSHAEHANSAKAINHAARYVRFPINLCRIEMFVQKFAKVGERLIDLRKFLEDRKSTRLNSSHANISYAVFCLKKKKKDTRMNYKK